MRGQAVHIGVLRDCGCDNCGATNDDERHGQRADADGDKRLTARVTGQEIMTMIAPTALDYFSDGNYETLEDAIEAEVAALELRIDAAERLIAEAMAAIPEGDGEE